MDRDLRNWLRGLAAPPPDGYQREPKAAQLSDGAAEYLARIAADGTLKPALAEIAATERELAG